MASKPRCIVDGKAIMTKVGHAPYLVGQTLTYCKDKHTKQEIMAAVRKHSELGRVNG